MIMQTFLPFEDFRKSFGVLDYRRLGKQRVEALQLIKVIEDKPRIDGKPYKGWKNHPATIMWKDDVDALKIYHNLCIQEWVARGYNNNMSLFQIEEDAVEMPKWLGFKPFHSSHRSVLLWKDFDFYSQYEWDEKPGNTYVWRDKQGKWYKYIRQTKKREYF